MSDDPKSTLQQAYNLIEAGSLSEARGLLKNYLDSYPNDADGWWLYANAVEDPAEGEAALRRVLSIDPNYADAREILDEMESSEFVVAQDESDDLAFLQETSDTPDFLVEVDDEDSETFEFDDSLPFSDEQREVEPVDDLVLASSAVDDEDNKDSEFDEFDFDDDEEMDEEPERRSTTRTFIGLLLLLAIIVIVVGIFIINPFGTRDDSNQVAGQQTPAATSEVTPEATDNGGSESSVAGELSAPFYTALEGLDVIEGSAVIEASSLGETFSISICSENSESVIRNNVDLALRLMADQSNIVGDQADALGIRLINCSEDNSIVRYIVVPLESAVAFSNRDISLTEFAANWEAEPLN